MKNINSPEELFEEMKKINKSNSVAKFLCQVKGILNWFMKKMKKQFKKKWKKILN